MRVRVHEPGRKGGVAEIDDLGVFRDGDVAPGSGDGVALDKHDAVRQKRFRFAVEKAGGLERDHLRWRVGRQQVR